MHGSSSVTRKYDQGAKTCWPSEFPALSLNGNSIPKRKNNPSVCAVATWHERLVGGRWSKLSLIDSCRVSSKAVLCLQF